MLKSSCILFPNLVAPPLHSESDKPSILGTILYMKNPQNFVPQESRLMFLRQTVFPKGGYNGVKQIKSRALYMCDCGIEKEFDIYKAKTGIVKSCGCLIRDNPVNKTHGLSKHPLFKVWAGILRRCYNKNERSYPYYGGGGVVVCNEWKNDFKSFFDWASNNGYRPGLQLDKDIKELKKGRVSKEYSPETCSFVTKIENANAKRNNRYINYRGEVKTLSEWSRIVGINTHAILSRFRCGWSVEKAFITPIKKR